METSRLIVLFGLLLFITSGEGLLQALASLNNHELCSGFEGRKGFCVNSLGCKSMSGVVEGNCRAGFSVCCVIYRTCGQTTIYNPTYFVSPSYPKNITEPTTCEINVNPASSSVAQVRLNFQKFSISQPVDGNCLQDSFSVSPQAFGTNFPRLCGKNSGQHAYVSFNERTAPLTLRMVISNDRAAETVVRTWLIEINQIDGDDSNRAPSGCLQYFTDRFGSFQSFNFETKKTSAELNNLNYGICFSSSNGHCGLVLDAETFSVSGKLGTTGAVVGDNCTKDYLLVPCGIPDGNSRTQCFDRFCGGKLGCPECNTNVFITTYTLPFTVHVITNNAEKADGDVNNVGFNINYQLLEC